MGEGLCYVLVVTAAPHRLAQIRAAFADCDDVRLALLFGSEARGEARLSSDVDIAVIAPGVDLLALGAKLAEALRCEVDVVDLLDGGVPLLEQVLRDGIVVHEAYRGEAARWRSRTLATLETDRPWYARMRDAWLERVRTEGIHHGRS